MNPRFQRNAFQRHPAPMNHTKRRTYYRPNMTTNYNMPQQNPGHRPSVRQIVPHIPHEPNSVNTNVNRGTPKRQREDDSNLDPFQTPGPTKRSS